MVLGKRPVLGRPTNLDNSGARAYCACSRCGRGCLDIIFSRLSLLFFLSSVWETARYRLGQLWEMLEHKILWQVLKIVV